MRNDDISSFIEEIEARQLHRLKPNRVKPNQKWFGFVAFEGGQHEVNLLIQQKNKRYEFFQPETGPGWGFVKAQYVAHGANADDIVKMVSRITGVPKERIAVESRQVTPVSDFSRPIGSSS